jgi:hypothetical protein
MYVFYLVSICQSHNPQSVCYKCKLVLFLKIVRFLKISTFAAEKYFFVLTINSLFT